jgi:hypothetical protein
VPTRRAAQAGAAIDAGERGVRDKHDGSVGLDRELAQKPNKVADVGAVDLVAGKNIGGRVDNNNPRAMCSRVLAYLLRPLHKGCSDCWVVTQ